MLPVERVKEEFLDALREHGTVVLTAPTGSGKSTIVPEWLAGQYDKPTVVVEPRRIACRSLAEYLAGRSGAALGDRVGYSVRFDEKCNAGTGLVFVTTGIALRWLDSGRLASAGCIVLDEFHERRWETDLLLAVLAKRHRGVPLVITSATLDAERVSKLLYCPVVTAEGRTFPVDVSYAEGVRSPSSDELADRVASAVVAAPNDGDVLVFLPGKGEIRDAESAIRRRGVSASIVAVHGGVPPAQLVAAFRNGDGRRVFLATNVAETSLTIPGVTTVVDSGLARRRVHRAGRSILALEPIARSSMDQRAGRAGRVRAGRCIRLWSERYRPVEFDEPEIARIELDEVILRASAGGLSGDAFASAPWLTPPPEFAVESATARLQELGAIGTSGDVSGHGKTWLSLPVGVDEGRLLSNCPKDLLSAVIDLVSAMDRGRRLMLPLEALGGRYEDVEESRRALFKGLEDEPTRLIACVRDGNPRKHGLHPDGLREVRRVADTLRRSLNAPARTPVESRRLARYVAEKWPRAVFVARNRALKRRVDGKMALSGEPWGNGEVELRVRGWSGASAKDKAGVVLDQEWLSDGATGARGVGGMVLPLRYADLMELGLGEATVTAARVRRNRGKLSIVGTVRRSLADVLLGEDERRLKGDELMASLPELVLRGSLFKSVGAELLVRIHVWKIVAAGQSTATDIPDAAEWLRRRIEELGVSEADDLQLVEDDDLLPDVADLTGAALWDIESVQKAFPLDWTFDGATYQCEVLPRRRLVRLRLARKATKRVKDPPRTALPNFQGFAVELHVGSRTVRLR